MLFAINGVSLWPPDGYQEAPIPIVGYNLRGEPIRQGYPSFVFTWSIMLQDRLTDLIDQYDPANPQVQLTYIDKYSGDTVTKYAMMEEPIIGARQIVYYMNVAVKFTRLSDTA